jgi:hypothetical protein
MAHGYLGDGYGLHGEFDPDRGEERDRNWRERGEHWSDRERGMMFSGRERDWSDDDRWSDRARQSEPSRGRRNFSANPDDHYRSWRDRHMSELDRDYADYCQEREQQFHRNFDDWLQQKYGNPQPLQTGMTQTGMSHDPSGEFQLTNEMKSEPSGTDPIADATLGTNSSGSRGGRSRR